MVRGKAEALTPRLEAQAHIGALGSCPAPIYASTVAENTAALRCPISDDPSRQSGLVRIPPGEDGIPAGSTVEAVILALP